MSDLLDQIEFHTTPGYILAYENGYIRAEYRLTEDGWWGYRRLVHDEPGQALKQVYFIDTPVKVNQTVFLRDHVIPALTPVPADPADTTPPWYTVV